MASNEAGFFARTKTLANYPTPSALYPEALYAKLLAYLDIAGAAPRALAVDIGCGSGHSTSKLAPYFDSVIGVDISPRQINAARSANNHHQNITFMVASFDNIPVQTGSVDLLTCATAAHWFGCLEDFFKDVDRVMRPGGVCAIYSHTWPEVHCQYKGAELTKIYSEFHTDPRIHQFKAPGIRTINEFYATLQMPYEHNERDLSFGTEQCMTLREFTGFVAGHSWYVLYELNHPEGPDLVEQLCRRMTMEMDASKCPDELLINLSIGVVLNLCRKPLAHIANHQHSTGVVLGHGASADIS